MFPTEEIPVQDEMTPEMAAKLREPFPPQLVGKLPRVTCRNCREAAQKVCAEHKKQRCAECGNWMTTAHMHLDYVGHAAATDRLLQVDPAWTWRPMAQTPEGFPVFDNQGGLWIWLTIGGVTRPGYGEPGNTGSKEAIGDAIRNAAMRFGVALDLWAKEDLHAEQSESPQPVSDADKKALVQLFMRKGGKTELEAAAWLASMGEKADSSAWVSQTRTALLEKPDAAKNPEPELPAEPGVTEELPAVTEVPW